MSRVTVVTACYNARPFIADTIRSIQNQDFPDWEYILVDDGSTDDTEDVVRAQTGGDRRIKLIKQPNAGTCQARNAGAGQASGESIYLLFLDHDDMLEPSALRVLAGYLDAHNDVCVAACQFQEVDLEGNAVSSKMRSRWAPSVFGTPRRLRPDEHETPFVTFYCGTGQGPFAMFRRRVFDEVGRWTTEFWPHEDTDLFCKMALRGKIHYLPDRLYRKRTHSGNALNDHDRLMKAYTSFRRKWDVYQPANESEAETLRSAARFYTASFRPLRHLKVGTKALGEFVRSGDPGKLRWGLSLYKAAARDALRYRFFAT
jgi:glycosyltransferase involved in cell wall biosynthesis